MRGDFVGKALAYRPLSDRLQDAQINLGPMTREELECAIRKPAEKIQLEFEAGLVGRILNDVGDEPGNLPLLEFVLKELWESGAVGLLLNETYDAIGGASGCGGDQSGRTFQAFLPQSRKFFSASSCGSCAPAESGEDTRRRAAFTELPLEGTELVVKLANERLLVTNQSASGPEQTVEVAHEALISNWGTLRAWVNEDREFLLWRDRLGTLLTEWERAQESDEALLRGPLLIEAQKWFDQRSQDLSDQERKFISASREQRERLAREEKERQERELEAARKLAEAKENAPKKRKRRRGRRTCRNREASKEQKESAKKLRVAHLWLPEQRRRMILLAYQFSCGGGSRAGADCAVQRDAAEEQARIAESRRLAAESSSALTKYPQRSLLLAVEAVKAEQPLHGVRVAADEQSLREALGFIGGRSLQEPMGP